MVGTTSSVGLSHKSIIVLDPAEDGESHKSAVRGRRHLQLGVWVRNAMDGLRRTGAIVVANVLAGDTADVTDAKEDEMVQGLLSQRPVEPLNIWRCIWSAKRNGEPFDAQDSVQPAVQVGKS